MEAGEDLPEPSAAVANETAEQVEGEVMHVPEVVSGAPVPQVLPQEVLRGGLLFYRSLATVVVH